MNKNFLVGFIIVNVLAFFAGMTAYVLNNPSLEERTCVKSHQEDLASKAPITVIHRYITICDEWEEVKQK